MTRWCLLLLTLPASHPGLRMRVWRAMKGLGAASLRDGAWLLPEPHDAGFAALMAEVADSGGQSESLRVTATGEQEARFRALFRRDGDYARLLEQVRSRASGGDLPGRRQLARLRRELESLEAIDFYPSPDGPGAPAVRAALRELERLESPGEPGAHRVSLPGLSRAEYRDRIWATRARPWVDRLASAWLIRRHIDAGARILWLASPGDCPPGALGFDFDGAAFSHVIEASGREWVTFEALLHSFGLAADPALARLAGVIHYLDVGGLPAPEAAGLEALLAGMRARLADDGALLTAACQVFDDLSASFLNGEPKSD